MRVARSTRFASELEEYVSVSRAEARVVPTVPAAGLKFLGRCQRDMRLRFDRRAVLAGLAIGIVALAAILVSISVLAGIPGAIVLVFPAFVLWLLIFVWVARKTMPPR